MSEFGSSEKPSHDVKLNAYELSTSNSLDAIIHNDVILRCQWTDLHTSKELSPEARLCLGVLRQALMDIAQPTSPIKSVREARAQDALAWLAGGSGYITLEHVCGMLRIGDVRGFGQRLLRAIAKHAKHSPRPQVKIEDAHDASDENNTVYHPDSHLSK